jgi:hypothetical protein
MAKVKVRQVNNARGFYIVSSPFGKYKVAGKEKAVSMAKATRRLIKKKAGATKVYN